MRKLLFILFGLILSTSAFADGGLKQYDKIIITLIDGRVFDIEIDTESYVYSFVEEREGNNVQLIEVIGTREEYIFERGEVKSMKFIEAIDTQIDEVADVSEKNPMRYFDGVLTFHRSLIGEKLYVYDVAGKIMLTATINEGGIVSLAHLSAGTYVAKVKDINIKAIVR